MIGGVRVEPERVRFWSGFGFGPGIVGGTGARAVKCHVVLAINCSELN